MEILCPHCQFSREVNEAKIPARSQIATCPKCQTKFKFRDLPDEDEFTLDDPEPQTGQAAPESEPPSMKDPEPKPAKQPTQVAVRQPTPVAVKQPDPEPTPRREPDSAFPALLPDDEAEELPKPAAKGKGDAEIDELWDKLSDMRPPHPGQRPDREPPKEAEPEPIPGWTGEFNESFPDPMDEEPKDKRPLDDDTASTTFDDAFDEAGPQVPPPFEQLDRYGFFPGLFMTVKLIITSPRLFFAVMPVGGGLAKPLTFTILVTMIQGLAQYLWQSAGLSTSMGAASPEPTGGAAGALVMLLFMPAIIAAGQFAITGIYHLLMIMMRADSQGFEGTFRALAYANAPLVLGVFPMPGMQVEIGWMAIVAVWVLALTIIGLKHIHRASYAKVVPVALIPLLLGLIGGVMAFYSQLATI